MSVYVVTRHAGALEWLQQQGVHYDQHIKHLNIELLQAGDQVIGNLPIPMVAQINEKGVRYWHLSFNVPYELRGQELSAQQLIELGIDLKEFRVELCE